MKIDIDKNRIYIQMTGYMQEDELEILSEKVKDYVLKLRPSFDSINDISQFKAASGRGRELIKETQEFMVTHKLSRVVRIVGESAIAKIQLARASKEVGYTAYTVSTLQEAEDILDGKIQVK